MFIIYKLYYFLVRVYFFYFVFSCVLLCLLLLNASPCLPCAFDVTDLHWSRKNFIFFILVLFWKLLEMRKQFTTTTQVVSVNSWIWILVKKAISLVVSLLIVSFSILNVLLLFEFYYWNDWIRTTTWIRWLCSKHTFSKAFRNTQIRAINC